MAEDQDDDAALVRSASAGDPIAVDRLLVAHLPALQAFVRLRLDPGLRAKVSGSDIVQSVCRELLEQLSGFEYRGGAAFRGWLFTAALNKIRKQARHHAAGRRARDKEVPLDAADADVRLCASLLTPGSAAAHGEAVGAIEAAFDRLAEDHREVITLARLVGLTHAEIGARLDRSEDAARQLLHRALARFSTELARQGLALE